MSFLESNKYVHRDVAARNCLGILPPHSPTHPSQLCVCVILYVILWLLVKVKAFFLFILQWGQTLR